MKETTYLDLLKEAAEKRNKLFYLYQLLSSPEYKAPWWYWLDYLKANSN